MLYSIACQKVKTLSVVRWSKLSIYKLGWRCDNHISYQEVLDYPFCWLKCGNKIVLTWHVVDALLYIQLNHAWQKIQPIQSLCTRALSTHLNIQLCVKLDMSWQGRKKYLRVIISNGLPMNLDVQRASVIAHRKHLLIPTHYLQVNRFSPLYPLQETLTLWHVQ